MAEHHSATRDRIDWAQMVRAARAGQPGALDRLVVATVPVVRGAIVRVLRGKDVEDAQQDAMELIVRKLDQLREPRRYPGWAYSVARNAALTNARQTARDIPVDVATGTFDRVAARSEIDRMVDRLAARQVLPSALARLTPSQFRVLSTLVCDGDAGYRSASASLNVPIGGLGPTRQRGLDRLRADTAVQTLVG